MTMSMASIMVMGTDGDEYDDEETPGIYSGGRTKKKTDDICKRLPEEERRITKKTEDRETHLGT